MFKPYLPAYLINKISFWKAPKSKRQAQRTQNKRGLRPKFRRDWEHEHESKNFGIFKEISGFFGSLLGICTKLQLATLSWPAIIKFFIFKVENIVFADVFVFLHTTKTTVLPYNRLCFQVQVVRALNQF